MKIFCDIQVTATGQYSAVVLFVCNFSQKEILEKTCQITSCSASHKSASQYSLLGSKFFRTVPLKSTGSYKKIKHLHSVFQNVLDTFINIVKIAFY